MRIIMHLSRPSNQFAQKFQRFASFRIGSTLQNQIYRSKYIATNFDKCRDEISQLAEEKKKLPSGQLSTSTIESTNRFIWSGPAHNLLLKLAKEQRVEQFADKQQLRRMEGRNFERS